MCTPTEVDITNAGFETKAFRTTQSNKRVSDILNIFKRFFVISRWPGSPFTNISNGRNLHFVCVCQINKSITIIYSLVCRKGEKRDNDTYF